MEGNRPQRKVDKSSTKAPKSETYGNNTGKERVSKIPASKIPARPRLSVIASEGNETSDLTGTPTNARLKPTTELSLFTPSQSVGLDDPFGSPPLNMSAISVFAGSNDVQRDITNSSSDIMALETEGSEGRIEARIETKFPYVDKDPPVDATNMTATSILNRNSPIASSSPGKPQWDVSYGDIVWVKTHPSFPYWPAYVFDPEELPTETQHLATKALNRSSPKHSNSKKRAVYFYGSEIFDFANIYQMKDFLKHRDELASQELKEDFSSLFPKALELADRDIQLDKTQRVSWVAKSIKSQEAVPFTGQVDTQNCSSNELSVSLDSSYSHLNYDNKPNDETSNFEVIELDDKSPVIAAEGVEHSIGPVCDDNGSDILNNGNIPINSVVEHAILSESTDQNSPIESSKDPKKIEFPSESGSQLNGDTISNTLENTQENEEYDTINLVELSTKTTPEIFDTTVVEYATTTTTTIQNNESPVADSIDESNETHNETPSQDIDSHFHNQNESEETFSVLALVPPTSQSHRKSTSHSDASALFATDASALFTSTSPQVSLFNDGLALSTSIELSGNSQIVETVRDAPLESTPLENDPVVHTIPNSNSVTDNIISKDKSVKTHQRIKSFSDASSLFGGGISTTSSGENIFPEAISGDTSSQHVSDMFPSSVSANVFPSSVSDKVFPTSVSPPEDTSSSSDSMNTQKKTTENITEKIIFPSNDIFPSSEFFPSTDSGKSFVQESSGQKIVYSVQTENTKVDNTTTHNSEPALKPKTITRSQSGTVFQGRALMVSGASPFDAPDNNSLFPSVSDSSLFPPSKPGPGPTVKASSAASTASSAANLFASPVKNVSMGDGDKNTADARSSFTSNSVRDADALFKNTSSQGLFDTAPPSNPPSSHFSRPANDKADLLTTFSAPAPGSNNRRGSTTGKTVNALDVFNHEPPPSAFPPAPIGTGNSVNAINLPPAAPGVKYTVPVPTPVPVIPTPNPTTKPRGPNPAHPKATPSNANVATSQVQNASSSGFSAPPAGMLPAPHGFIPMNTKAKDQPKPGQHPGQTTKPAVASDRQTNLPVNGTSNDPSGMSTSSGYNSVNNNNNPPFVPDKHIAPSPFPMPAISNPLKDNSMHNFPPQAVVPKFQQTSQPLPTTVTLPSPPTVALHDSTMFSNSVRSNRIIGRPACPAVSFGFRGHIAIMVPKYHQPLNPLLTTPEDLERPYRCGPVKCFRVADLITNSKTRNEESAIFIENLRSFTGPLLHRNDAKGQKGIIEEIHEFISSRFDRPVSSCISDSYYSKYQLCDKTTAIESEKMLLKLLRIIVDNNGAVSVLSSHGDSNAPTPEKAIVNVLLGNTDGIVNTNLESTGSLLTTPEVEDMYASFTPPTPKPSDHSSIGDNSVSRPCINLEIENLLLLGRREEAINYAMDNNEWAMALLISGICGTQLYQDVVKRYANACYPAESSLHLLSLVYSNQALSSTRIPKQLGPSPLQVNTRTIVSLWRRNLASILSNKVEQWKQLVRLLGDRILTEKKDIMASHFAYLCSASLPSKSITRSQKETDEDSLKRSGKYVLVGCDSGQPRFRALSDAVSISSFRMTEILEWAMTSGSKISSQKRPSGASSSSSSSSSTSSSSTSFGISFTGLFGMGAGSSANANTVESTPETKSAALDYPSEDRVLSVQAVLCPIKLRFAFVLADYGFINEALAYASEIKSLVGILNSKAPQNPGKPPASSDAAAASAKAGTPFSKKFVCELEEFIGRISGPQSISQSSTGLQTASATASGWGIGSVLSSISLKDLVDGPEKESLSIKATPPTVPNVPPALHQRSSSANATFMTEQSTLGSNNYLPQRNSADNFVMPQTDPGLVLGQPPVPMQQYQQPYRHPPVDNMQQPSQYNPSMFSPSTPPFPGGSNTGPSSIPVPPSSNWHNPTQTTPAAFASPPFHGAETVIQPVSGSMGSDEFVNVDLNHNPQKSLAPLQIPPMQSNQKPQTKLDSKSPANASTAAKEGDGSTGPSLFGNLRKNVISFMYGNDVHDANENTGKALEAYYDKASGRWVFPGEEDQAASGPGLAPPPTGPMPGPISEVSSSNISDSNASDQPYDPLAALMAPPSRSMNPSTASYDPIAALMAPPSRGPPTMYSQSMPGASSSGPPTIPNVSIWRPPAVVAVPQEQVQNAQQDVLDPPPS